MKNHLTVGLIGIIGVLAAITGYDQFRKVSSYALSEPTSLLFPAEEKVVIAAKAYNSQECKHYLGHDLTSRGVVPFEISIANYSSRQYSICASSVDLPHLDPKDAALRVTKSAIPRAVAYRVASLIFWPISVPAAIDGFRFSSNHRKLKNTYRLKALKEKGEIVAPYSIYHRLLFIPEEEANLQFTVTLIDLETLEQKSYQTIIPSDASYK